MIFRHSRETIARSDASLGWAIAWALAITLAALALTGCGVSARTYCYTATAATVTAVDTGMSVAGDLYRAGKLTESQKATLIASHTVYRPIAKAAVDACRAISREAVEDADKQIKAIQAAGAHVIEALVAAGVK